MVSRVQELPLWPGIAECAVRMESDQLEVTTFGDAERRYVRGLTRQTMTLEVVGRDEVETLMAVVAMPLAEVRRLLSLAPAAAAPEPSPPLARRPVRFIEL